MTLTALYQYITGDHDAHPRTIAAHVARLDKRRQRMIRARLEGKTLREIAKTHGVSFATVDDCITRAMKICRKKIAGEPRYSVPHPGRWGKRKAHPAPALPHQPSTRKPTRGLK
jgi:hypothetical protein